MQIRAFSLNYSVVIVIKSLQLGASDLLMRGRWSICDGRFLLAAKTSLNF